MSNCLDFLFEVLDLDFFIVKLLLKLADLFFEVLSLFLEQSNHLTRLF